VGGWESASLNAVSLSHLSLFIAFSG